MVDWIMALQTIFMPKSLEPVNINLYEKKRTEEIIKLRILRWRNYPGLSE